jgi:hypothetical protein
MILCASQFIFEVITINGFYVANDTVLIFDWWNIKNRRIGLDRLVFNDRPAYDMVVNGRPARTLYFSRETRKEEGGLLTRWQSATMTLLKIEKTRQPSIIGQANRAIFFRNYIKKKHKSFCLANFAV